MDSGHKDYLDGWRGIAVMLLLAGHFSLIPPIFGHTLYTGRLGVECFFVLSGRLMAEILFVRQTPIPVFYQRRFSRIFPALWAFIVALFVAGIIAASDALKAITFTANYFPSNANLDHIWSLCVEEHAYILLSGIALLYRRGVITKIPAWLSAISLLCIVNGAAQTWLLHRSYFDVYWHSDVRIASVFMSAAMYLSMRETNTKNLGAIPILLVLLGFAISIPVTMPDPLKYSIGTLSITAGLLTLHRGWSAPVWILSAKPLTLLGIWSFSIYLWQQPFYGSKLLVPAVLLCMTFAVSLASFYLIEKPARLMINRLRFQRPLEIRQTP